MLDSRGTRDQRSSFWIRPITSRGRAILMPAAAEADSAARISIIASREGRSKRRFSLSIDGGVAKASMFSLTCRKNSRPERFSIFEF
jgi:hypothetical protein